MALLTQYQTSINERVQDVTIGYFVCGDEDVFFCKVPDAHFPRLKLFDFKKELEFNLTQASFEKDFTRIKHFVVPRVLLVKSESHFDELLELSPLLCIGYFPSNDTERLEATKKLAKLRKQSTEFFDVAMLDDSLLPKLADRFDQGFGFYIWFNNDDHKRVLRKHSAQADDTNSLITFLEVENLPDVVYYSHEKFGAVFAGSVSVAVPDSDADDLVRG